MDANLVNKVAKTYIKQRPAVQPGDTVKLHLKIKEGDKERIQVFEGIVLAIKGHGSSKSITVRKVAAGGIGVEKIVPLQTPTLTKIEIVKRGTVRRSKLYYMRQRIGKKAMDITNAESVYMTDEEDKPKEPETAGDEKKEDSAEKTTNESTEEVPSKKEESV